MVLGRWSWRVDGMGLWELIFVEKMLEVGDLVPYIRGK
jgi:hypothetical protein